MSREDQVFTKKAVVVVAVLTTVGGWVAQAGVAGWRARDQVDEITQKATIAATAAAVAAVQTSVEPIKVQMAALNAKVEEKGTSVEQRLSRLEDRVFPPEYGSPRRAR